MECREAAHVEQQHIFTAPSNFRLNGYFLYYENQLNHFNQSRLISHCTRIENEGGGINYVNVIYKKVKTLTTM